MSLVVSSFSAGNMLQAGGGAGAGGTVSASGTAAAAGGAAAQPFAQQLVQTMNGANTQAGAAPQSGGIASLLQGLLAAVQSGGEEADSASHIDLLQNLTEDMEQLDESLAADPALLAALQGWLLQVTQLLSGKGAPDQEGANEGNGNAVLSPLAQNPETIRFAVQDELNSLVTMLQQANVEGDQALTGSGAELLKQFSAIMTEAAATENKAKSKGSNHTDSAALVPVKNNVAADNGGKSQPSEKVVPVLVNSSAATTAATITPLQFRQVLVNGLM